MWRRSRAGLRQTARPDPSDLDRVKEQRVSFASMEPRRYRGGRALPILVALAVVALVGHICALPIEAAWNVVADHEAAPATEPHDADGAHIASCAATVSKTAPVLPRLTGGAPLVASATAAILPLAVAWNAAPEYVLLPRRAPDRSLFLLNRSFLI